MRALKIRKKNGELLALLGLFLGLGGCFAKRDGYSVPSVPIASSYQNAPKASEKDPAWKPLQKDIAADDGGYADWWRFFGSDELKALIDRGLANNPDVRIYTIRLAQAKARAEQARAGLLPSLSAPLLVGRQAPSGSVGVVPTGSAGGPQNAAQASLKGEWRVDVWGEQSSLAESANFQLWRAVFERDNVQRNVASSLAEDYVQFLALNDRIRLARETEKLYAETLATMEKRVKLGDATLVDLEQQKAAIYGLRAAIPSLEQQREDALNAMAFTVGSVPGGLKLSEAGLDTLSLPASVPGLPSALLLRRPDIRMMEARLLAADADIDVARTRILPPVDLSAQTGYSSNSLAPLFQPKIFFWSAVASLTASIFDAGRRENEKKYAEAVYEEMVETYVRTIYQAMREVEGSLVSVRLIEKQFLAQQEAALAARRAWEMNMRIFSMGGTDLITLLESERNYHRYVDDFRRAQMDNFRAYVSLFHALGGGVKPSAIVLGSGAPLSRKVDAGGIRAALAASAPETPVASFDGVDLQGGSEANASWQIELPGLYYRSTVGSAWRDLRTRFPEMMSGRSLLPRLSGKVDEENGRQEAWYRLSIAPFKSEAEAERYCQLMQESHERCRIMSSRADAKPKNVAPRAPAQASLGETKGEPVSAALAAAPGNADTPFAQAPDSLAPAAAAQSAAEQPAYSIQLGVFLNRENAEIARSVWEFRGYEVDVREIKEPDGRSRYSVRTGMFANRRDGLDAAKAIRRKEEVSAILLPVTSDERKLSPIAGRVRDPKNAGEVVPEPPEAIKPSLRVISTTRNSHRKGGEHPFYAVQLGAFSTPENAGVSLDFWRSRGVSAYVAPIRDAEDRQWFALRTGDSPVRAEVSALALKLGKKENANAMVVPVSLAENGRPLSVDVPLPKSEPEPSVEATSSGKTAEAGRSAASAPAAARPRFSIQLGAFASIENAASSMAEWMARGYDPYVCEIDDAAGNLRFSVRTGEFFSKAHGMVMVRSIQRQDNQRGVLVPAVLDQKGSLRKIDVTPLLPKTSMLQNESVDATR